MKSKQRLRRERQEAIYRGGEYANLQEREALETEWQRQRERALNRHQKPRQKPRRFWRFDRYGLYRFRHANGVVKTVAFSHAGVRSMHVFPTPDMPKVECVEAHVRSAAHALLMAAQTEANTHRVGQTASLRDRRRLRKALKKAKRFEARSQWVRQRMRELRARMNWIHRPRVSPNNIIVDEPTTEHEELAIAAE